MKKSLFLSGAVCIALAGSMFFSACNKGGGGLDSEDDALVISSEALDGVFNPFFYTTGPDGDVVGQTQIGMLTTDADGNLVCGENEVCVVLDYATETTGSKTDYDTSGSYENYYTEYWFAIKNGIKFSDGTDLTIKDVIFSLYVLLDPAYTGSSTLYSTNIRGLTAYRTQDRNAEDGSENQVDEYYESLAEARIDVITQWCDDEDSTMDDLTALDAQIQESEGYSILSYIDYAKTQFRQELNSDWTTAETSLTGESEYETKYGFTETWQVYAAIEGIIAFIDHDNDSSTVEQIDWQGVDQIDHSQESMVNYVYERTVGDSLLVDEYKAGVRAITTGGWATADTLFSYVTSQVRREDLGGEKEVKTISGIEILEDQTSIGSDTPKSLGGSYDVLKITVNGVDPKAIYNFSFTVAPMHYYSTQEETEKFDYAAGNVGVPWSDSDFFNEMSQIQVPMGAGPYKASNVNTDVGNSVPAKSEFFRDNIVYFERNTYFETVGEGITNAKIRKLRYQVIASTQLFDQITGASGRIMYGAPSARQSYLQQLGTMSDRFAYDLANTNGYGYIGINAGMIPEIEIRRAIMYAFDPSLCLSYFGDQGLYETIYRPMSITNWAYPQGCDPYYEFDNSENHTEIRELVSAAGYTELSSDGKTLRNPSTGRTLKFTFTIAGESDDHPATQVFVRAAEILNECGFDITVTPDPNALRKLATGDLTVWAAAWSSTIDPDMYQVYHKDSNATSTNNWGYREIYDDDNADLYGTEISIIDELSDLIDEARELMDQEDRIPIYHECLDLVMELAVEFPLYQRNDLFVWNTECIDSSTLLDATPYQSPISEIWNVDFVH